VHASFHDFMNCSYYRSKSALGSRFLLLTVHFTVIQTGRLYLSRPKYITLTSAHQRCPGLAAPGMSTWKDMVASSPGAAAKPMVHGPVACQLPCEEIS